VIVIGVLGENRIQIPSAPLARKMRVVGWWAYAEGFGGFAVEVAQFKGLKIFGRKSASSNFMLCKTARELKAIIWRFILDRRQREDYNLQFLGLLWPRAIDYQCRGG
jgi:hypothetical protein